MASLADIPPELLEPTAADKFVAWLIPLPIPPSTRIALARLWQRYNSATLPPHSWTMIDFANAKP